VARHHEEARAGVRLRPSMEPFASFWRKNGLVDERDVHGFLFEQGERGGPRRELADDFYVGLAFEDDAPAEALEFRRDDEGNADAFGNDRRRRQGKILREFRHGTICPVLGRRVARLCLPVLAMVSFAVAAAIRRKSDSARRVFAFNGCDEERECKGRPD
jgi:hypothetical protein